MNTILHKTASHSLENCYYSIMKRIILLLTFSLAFSQSIMESGILKDNSGHPVTVNVSMQYKIYRSPELTKPLWTSALLTVKPDEGVYSIVLGDSTNPLDENIFSGPGDYYLEQSINGETLKPLKQIFYNPQSIFALKSNTADVSLKAQNSEFSALANTANIALSALSAQISNTADFALLAQSVSWINITDRPDIVTKGMLAQVQSTANYALRAQSSELSALAGTANIAITANTALWAQSSGFSALSGTSDYALLSKETELARKVYWNNVYDKPNSLVYKDDTEYIAPKAAVSSSSYKADFALTANKLVSMKISQFSNDSAYLAQESDPLVKSYAKTKDENQLSVSTANYALRTQSSELSTLANMAQNANYAITASALTSMKISQFSNDSGFITSQALNNLQTRSSTMNISPGTAANIFLNMNDQVILANTANGPVSIFLPAAANFTGKFYTIKKIDSGKNKVTIRTNGLDKIDTDDLYFLSIQNEYVNLISDGDGWHIIGNN
ncbi:MAG: hypothetical protein PHV30_05210 [Candidatus Margulisbacteria bacterium]|nr:hypothetical protein [Candidatus Margulisiibacteriota bacterium]